MGFLKKDFCMRFFSALVNHLTFLPYCSGGRVIKVLGHNLDVVQKPRMQVMVVPPDSIPPWKKRRRRRKTRNVTDVEVQEADCTENTYCSLKKVIFSLTLLNLNLT